MVCPNCGEHNPERARFCLNCGHPLGRQLRQGEERKIVTALFCDLVGFTARSDRADPEDVKATLRPFHAAMKREIERYGGTLDKFVGDGVLGVFGAPQAHEDDPIRAVSSALRIQDAVAELNEAQPALGLSVRVGVATGEAVVAYGEGPQAPQVGESVTGDVLGTASRIQSAALPGSVVVAESTHAATRNYIKYQELGPVEVAGLAEAPRLWRAVGMRARLGVGIELSERFRTPFIAREDELFLLKATYRRAVRERSLQLVTVTGEPGIGKSRLIAEFRAYINDLPEIARWRQGRCLPYGDGITFWALGEIVKAHAGILESDGSAEAEAKLATAVASAVADEQERDWLRVQLAPLAGVGGPSDSGRSASASASGSAEGDRREAFTAWRRFLEALAAQYPLILVFEDLHWADEAMLAFIEHLLESSTGLPLMLLCAGRPELYERHPDWGAGRRNSTTVALRALSDHDTSALVSSLLDQEVLPAATRTALLERSGGNPLYAEEFVRMLTDQGILERLATGQEAGEGAEGAGTTGTSIPVPDSVQALVAARLDTLPADRKALLYDAAVLGQVFWDGAIASMSGTDLEAVRAALREMARKELVRPQRSSSVKGQEEYSFWHVLVGEVAYAQIPRTARGEKHRAAARWVESVAGERVADRAEVLAHHWQQALEMARATGAADVAELAESSARYLLMAGDRALRLDLAKAERHYRRALALLPSGHRMAPRILVAAGRAAVMAGGFDRARRDAAEAITAARAAGDRTQEGAALVMLASSLLKLGETPRARQALDRARVILEGEPPGPELVQVYSRMAGQRVTGGRFDEGLELAERALALATELGLEDEEVRARQFLGAARCDLGDSSGLEDLWEALRRGLELGLGEETALCYGNLAYQLWLREGPDIALQVWSSSKEFCEVRGFTAHAVWSNAGLLEVLFDLGRWDEVLGTAAEMIAWDDAMGGSEAGMFARVYRAHALLWQGQVEAAAEVVEEFLPQARTGEQRAELAAPALAVAMRVLHAGDEARRALDLLDEYRRETAEHPGYRLGSLPTVLRAVLAAGLVDEGAAMVPPESAVAAPRWGHSRLTAMALVAEARGAAGEAARLFGEAASRWRRYGFRLEEALALAGRARALVALGRPAEAEDRYREGADLLADIGVPLAVAGAGGVEAELGRLEPSS